MGDRTDLPETPPANGDNSRVRIGLVATDTLRVLGLQEILRGAFSDTDEDRVVVLPLSVPGVLDDAGLTLVLIDASCTDHLMELLTTFHNLRPQVRLIVIGDTDDQDYIRKIIGAGAKGYLTQTAQESEIRLALNIVRDGSIWAPRKILARLLDASTHREVRTSDSDVQFTRREIEVLRLLVTGLSNRAIAQELHIDESTAKAHLSRLMRKLGVTNRIELSVKALALNLTA